MYKKIIVCFALLAMMVSAQAFAQLKKDTKINMSQALTQPTKVQTIIGLIGLDPNKFSMSHSYSLMFTSFGGQSYNQGLYLNTMKYQLSNPISMYLQFGFAHQPLGNWGQNSLQQNQFFISGAGLEYKPSDKFKMQIEFSQYPRSNYSSYNNRLYHRTDWFKKEEKEN
ncbi:MAG: hypothetical protein ACE5HS_03270 [bacterium]